MAEAAEEEVNGDDGSDAGPKDPKPGAENFASISLHEDQSYGLVDRRLHPVDNDAGDGDIKPDGPGVSRQLFMSWKAAAERKEEGNEDHGERDDRQKNVRKQELPVEGPPRAHAVEVSLSMQVEVDQVGDQKDRREDKRREHRCTMLRDFARADETVADEQRDGRECVEDGVDERQRAELGSRNVRRGVEVHQPADEGTGGSADRNNAKDDGRRRTNTGSRWSRWRVHQKSRRPFESIIIAAISKGR